MDPAIRTSAASGINTMVLRKNVVKPNVSPNPGRTLGCLSLAISNLIGAQRRYTEWVAAGDPTEKLRAAHDNHAGLFELCHRRSACGAVVPSMHDEYRPVTFGEQRA